MLADKGVIRTEMEYAELVGIFNSASSFDKFRNTKVLPNKPNFNDLYSRTFFTKTVNNGAYIVI